MVSFLAVLTRVALVEMKVILIHGMKVQDRVHAMMLSSYKIFFFHFFRIYRAFATEHSWMMQRPNAAPLKTYS